MKITKIVVALEDDLKEVDEVIELEDREYVIKEVNVMETEVEYVLEEVIVAEPTMEELQEL